MTTEGISVVICCYNSAERLPETLKHLAKQVVPNTLQWEVILVDNLSTDNTAEIATKIWQDLNTGIPYKVVLEDTPGLTNARVKGVTSANYDLIIFCDDDNWLDTNFLAQAKHIQELNKDIALFGIGESIPVYETKPPKWIKKHNLEGLFACFVRSGDEMGTGDENIQICGAGMCITKQLGLKYIKFLQEEPMHKLLDRTGNTLNSGGDSDINYLCVKLGLQSGNFKSLKIQHYIPTSRIQLPYIYKLVEGNSYSSNFLQFINQGTYNKLKSLSKISYLVRELAKSLLNFYLGLANLQGRKRFERFLKHNKLQFSK
jgi:glycosyltransferase involved in cell wall biosynthesis